MCFCEVVFYSYLKGFEFLAALRSVIDWTLIVMLILLQFGVHFFYFF